MDGIIERNRRNQIAPHAEAWKPPVFGSGTSFRARVRGSVRRFFDLPAGSIWRDLRDILPTCQGRVLDIGCGAQPYRELFPASAVYLGIDTEHARESFGYDAPDTVHYDGKTWPVATNSIDVALATETLEHVEDTAEFLAEAARCVRPGGWLVLSVPFAARWHFIPYDYWRFTPSGLISVLRPHGFTPTVIWARGDALTVACYKVMALIFPLFFSTSRSVVVRWLLRLAGLVFVPLLTMLALIGTASLYGPGGDDCLGYTVVAVLDSDRTASIADAGSSPESPRRNV